MLQSLGRCPRRVPSSAAQSTSSPEVSARPFPDDAAQLSLQGRPGCGRLASSRLQRPALIAEPLGADHQRPEARPRRSRSRTAPIGSLGCCTARAGTPLAAPAARTPPRRRFQAMPRRAAKSIKARSKPASALDALHALSRARTHTVARPSRGVSVGHLQFHPQLPHAPSPHHQSSGRSSGQPSSSAVGANHNVALIERRQPCLQDAHVVMGSRPSPLLCRPPCNPRIPQSPWPGRLPAPSARCHDR